MRRRSTSRRRGSVMTLTALIMVILFGLIAFAVDLGYLSLSRTEMQRTADAAAIAAAWDLIDTGALRRAANPDTAVGNARATAERYATINPVCKSGSQLAVGDVVIGRLSSGSSGTMSLDDPTRCNAVQIRVRWAGDTNAQVPLMFARVWGLVGQSIEAQATAMFVDNVGGFQTPADGSNLEILPFALDKETWDGLMAGSGTDNWRYNPETKTVTAGSDGILEVNLYPQGIGSPGNRGTVDIGKANNSTSDISRQIVSGISKSDMDAIGGKLEFNSDGKLYLNGDTGISAGVKDELASIIGKPRIIPIFESVSGNGNNANYTIVHFAGVRIMEVQLTGSGKTKHVTIQPAQILAKGIIPGNGTPRSTYIYSPVWLVR